jgi:hypothetical protein
MNLRPTDDDPDLTFEHDIWPLLVVAARDPADSMPWVLDHAYAGLGDGHATRLRNLVAEYDRDGGLTADFSAAPGFAVAVERARRLRRAGRDDEAFAAIQAGLPDWRPLSPLHLAPMGLVWDRELGPLMTVERRRQVLVTPRGGADRGPGRPV